MLHGFLILIGCQLAGEIIVGLGGLSIPGPVMGMVLLFAGLMIRGGVPEGLETAGGGLLKHIGLLYVPAGAGISLYLGLIAREWDVILIASVSATVLTLVACGLLFQRWGGKGGHDA